ncbi:CNNM domain-containing protein [Kineobactrum salinum]|uniref:HlyC/CorC family transporter n=1 Tax=Kineobactrum salinum TaxID=2708301 RepID=A0A6C0U7T8_9GAMM|nr:hemolysin family protein [Kineobactrum salinum]QIB67057.1 HlyC/CorC family transporter [Kineobactrum salinum]
MTLLLIAIGLALGISFICSVAEAVLLSVTTAYTTLLEQEGRSSGRRLRALKQDVDRPLSAILTLNTIAHTAGATVAGAQAAIVFGSSMLGVFSAILTLLILVFSEIIPKTLGAFYWRQLAPMIAHILHGMIILLYPFVVMSNWMTRLITRGQPLRGLSRAEFAVMAEVGEMEGELGNHETRILQNLLGLREKTVKDVMTPRPVLFTLPQDMQVADYFEKHGDAPFSRIPIYGDNQDDVTGFVLRGELILAKAREEQDKPLSHYRRELPALVGAIDLLRAFEVILERGAHLMLVVDEYGGVDGVITLEDIFETLVGREIVDEVDRTADLQRLARRLGQRRNKRLGVEAGKKSPDGNGVP